jgi:hypothetical protein
LRIGDVLRQKISNFENTNCNNIKYLLAVI